MPLTKASPYGGGWLPVIATALSTDFGLSVEPRDATVTQVAQAVVAYNRRHGLAATSFVRADTWQKLQRHTVRRPARGPVVRGGQMFLRNYGFMASRHVIGIFGPVTRQAVTRFQSAAQIRVTGVIGPNEWAALWWGPAGWAISADRLGRGEEWTRTPEGQPTGEIEHSWEGTLRALTPLVERAAGSALWASRAIYSHISR
ncbi:MAG: peptidoglycan-binding protein [Acidobacteria bacterium]|nr:peptidoglycan-binding protein [Acidobacteriota bacterium]